MSGYTRAAARYAASPDSITPIPQYVEAVWQDTWGHLAPKAQEPYRGFILFTFGVHGDLTVIDWDFKLVNGEGLPGSPWFHEDLHDFVGRQIEKKGHRHGGVWRFDGTFLRHKNGRSRWSGKTSPMHVVYRFPKKR
jgi:hypothetical protein